MLRKDIENYMKEKGQKYIVLLTNKDDELGILCWIQTGVLIDYTGHRVDRKANIWGRIDFVEGKPQRIAW